MSPTGELSWFLPSFKMDGRKKDTRERKGRGREERRERGKPRGGGGRPKYEQTGARNRGAGGGSVLARPGPSSWDLPPTRPRNSLAHSPGWAGQGRAELARKGEPARGEPWKVQTHQWGPGGQ